MLDSQVVIKSNKFQPYTLTHTNSHPRGLKIGLFIFETVSNPVSIMEFNYGFFTTSSCLVQSELYITNKGVLAFLVR